MFVSMSWTTTFRSECEYGIECEYDFQIWNQLIPKTATPSRGLPADTVTLETRLVW